jgi:hypothetical protein
MFNWEVLCVNNILVSSFLTGHFLNLSSCTLSFLTLNRFKHTPQHPRLDIIANCVIYLKNPQLSNIIRCLKPYFHLINSDQNVMYKSHKTSDDWPIANGEWVAADSWAVISRCRYEIFELYPNLYSTGSPLTLSNNLPHTDLRTEVGGTEYEWKEIFPPS